MVLLVTLLAIAVGSAEIVPPPRRAAPPRARTAQRPRAVWIDGDHYAPRQRFKGISAGAFELSSFGGCWFTSSFEFSRQFEQLGLPRPPATMEIVRYELEFIGRQTFAKRGELGGYGHLGMWHCQIRAETLISARLLPS